MVVLEERGHELVGLAAVEAVPAVEPAGQRPCGARRGHVGLVLGAQVPLADGVGGIALLAQDLGEVAVLPGRPAPVARVARPPGRPRGPCRCGGGCARSTGRRGTASRGRWCGSWPVAHPRRPSRRSPGCRWGSRNNRAGRTPRRRARRARHWAPRAARWSRVATMAPTCASLARCGRRTRVSCVIVLLPSEPWCPGRTPRWDRRIP